LCGRDARGRARGMVRSGLAPLANRKAKADREVT